VTLLAIFLVFILFLLAVVLLSGVKVIREYEKAVIFRWGRLRGARGPGLIYVVPGLEKMQKVDLRIVTVDVPVQDMITSDNIPVKVNAVLYYRVQDPNLAVVQVERYRAAIAQGAQTTLRTVLGQHSLNDLLTKREAINNKLLKIIDEMSDPWGIKVTGVETKDVVIPSGMQRAMAKKAEAMREKEARIIKAEGEMEATGKLSEAADMIRKNPAILELRRMQMVTEVGMEQNTTTIVLMPSEFVSAAGALGKIAESLGGKS